MALLKKHAKKASETGVAPDMQRSLLFSSLPNLITLARLVLVPLIIWLIANGQWGQSCVVFIVAGVSDGVDGFLARHFNLRTELGAYLDALADKALLTSIYVTLAIVHDLPSAIAILVVSRDVMIISAILISWLMTNPVEIRPLFISKANTTAQIGFAALVLGAKAFNMTLGVWFDILMVIVAILTIASAIAYMAQWFKHMASVSN